MAVKKQKAGINWKFIIVFIAIPIVLLTPFWIALFRGSSATTSDHSPIPSPTAKPRLGINISRTALIKVYEREGLVFKKSEPINGEENYVADKDGLEVQLLGPEENLSEADVVATINPYDAGNSVVRLTKIMLLSGQGGKDCSQWVAQKITNMDVNKPSEITENVCGRSLTLIYIPGNSESLGIKPAN